MNTIKEDAGVPLMECTRWWMRLPAALLAIPVCLIFLVIAGVSQAVVDWFEFSFKVIVGGKADGQDKSG